MALRHYKGSEILNKDVITTPSNEMKQYPEGRREKGVTNVRTSPSQAARPMQYFFQVGFSTFCAPFMREKQK